MRLMELNNDVLSNIITFLSKDFIVILSEVNSLFYELVLHRLKYFPNKSLIYSSFKLFEWSLNHNYLTGNKNKVRKIIKQVIKYGNVELMDYVKYYFCDKFELESYFYILCLKYDKSDLFLWLKRNYCPYDLLLNFEYKKYESYYRKQFVFTKEELYDVIKNDDIKEIKWILNSVKILEPYVLDFASEVGSNNVFKWMVNRKSKTIVQSFNLSIILENLSMTGNITMLQWINKRYQIYPDEWTLYSACYHQKYDIIKWCLQMNCKINQETKELCRSNINLQHVLK